jgi:Family of unknown function (DUF6011)
MEHQNNQFKTPGAPAMTKTMLAKFHGTCTRCKGTFAAGTKIQWTSGAGATHADLATCAATPAPVATPRATVTANAKPIADFLLAAKARGLKFPSVTFLAPAGAFGQTIRLSVAGDQSKVPGSIQVKLDGEWIGRVEPDGTVVGRNLAGSALLLDTLATIAADPAAAAKAYGKASGFCSFCSTQLSDDREGSSVDVGYGPTCAKRYGLPHHPKGKRHELKPLAPVVVVANANGLEVVDASDLGLTGFPQDVRYDGDSFLLRTVYRDAENDITSAAYVGTGGRELVIVND